MWAYSRAARLGALAFRADALARHLRREWADAPKGSAARAGLFRRVAVVESRAARLRMLARVARHNARSAV